MTDDKKTEPLSSAELEAEAERDHAARGTKKVPDTHLPASEAGESELREGEERAVRKSLTELPPD